MRRVHPNECWGILKDVILRNTSDCSGGADIMAKGSGGLAEPPPRRWIGQELFSGRINGGRKIRVFMKTFRFSVD